MCALKRPFDDQNQSRVWIETQAVVRILEAFHQGHCAVVNSDALVYENRWSWLLRALRFSWRRTTYEAH